jgi:hypothetical protein
MIDFTSRTKAGLNNCKKENPAYVDPTIIAGRNEKNTKLKSG